MDREMNQREIIVRLFQVSNTLQKYMDKLLKDDSLTTKQFFMMIILGSFEDIPKLGEISERFGTSRQNAKQVLLKLEKSGYVKSFKDKGDSRITRFIMTEKAQKYWHSRSREDDITINQIFSVLKDQELEGFSSALIKMLCRLQELSNDLS